MKVSSSLLLSCLSACILLITGCDQNQTTSEASAQIQVEFAPSLTSATPMQEAHSSPEITVNGESQPLRYHTLFRTGDQNNGETFGLLKDVNQKPILFEDGSKYLCSGTNQGAGSGLDHISILQKDHRLFMVSQYECAIGAMYLNELEQNTKGQLSVKANSLQFIDQSSEFGGYVHCAGQTTPWQSHLGSEEYEPDAREVEANFDPKTGLTGNGYYDEQRLYWQNDLARTNPYYYGWIPEVTLESHKDKVTPNYTKHYAMGRFSHELAYVMPDLRTVYMSDDGTNGGFFLYIADQAENLSAGHLYAAKWIQTSDKGQGEAQIHWVDLGHSSDKQIRQWVAQKPKFSQLFKSTVPDANGQCPGGFRSINTMFGHECLKLEDINGDNQVSRSDEILAARLETRRMAAYLGATTEFRKAEGITFNPEQNRLYLSISEIARGMEDYQKNGQPSPKFDQGGHNDIRLQANPCGGVYQLNVTTNSNMNSDYVATEIKGMVAGIPQNNSQNGCSLQGLANPDNISFLAGSNSLLIGEDTDKHQNNLLWSYNIETQKLTPVFSAPTGAETTSPFWHRAIYGFSYITLVTQHPLKGTLNNHPSEAGYLGPIKLD